MFPISGREKANPIHDLSGTAIYAIRETPVSRQSDLAVPVASSRLGGVPSVVLADID